LPTFYIAITMLGVSVLRAASAKPATAAKESLVRVVAE